MDPRVRKAILQKIESAILNTSEVASILERLKGIPVSSKDDLAFGIAIGRIYNSFHYQTRRILKRNATEKEFAEFLEILDQNANALKAAFGKS